MCDDTFLYNTSRNISKRPDKTPKTPWKTPGRPIETKTPRTIHKSAFKSAKKSKKKKPRKPRKSQLDISTLTDEQVALAALQSNQILSLKLRKRHRESASMALDRSTMTWLTEIGIWEATLIRRYANIGAGYALIWAMASG